MQNKTENQIKEISDLEEDKKTNEEGNNKKIKLINKEYEVLVDSRKAKASKLHAIGVPGQAVYNIAQGMSNVEKSKSDKESLIQQVQQDNQNQQGNTVDGIKKEIDKLADFDPFQRNSSSQR